MCVVSVTVFSTRINGDKLRMWHFCVYVYVCVYVWVHLSLLTRVCCTQVIVVKINVHQILIADARDIIITGC